VPAHESLNPQSTAFLPICGSRASAREETPGPQAPVASRRLVRDWLRSSAVSQYHAAVPRIANPSRREDLRIRVELSSQVQPFWSDLSVPKLGEAMSASPCCWKQVSSSAPQLRLAVQRHVLSCWNFEYRHGAGFTVERKSLRFVCFCIV
jgi:hypothetical protein